MNKNTCGFGSSMPMESSNVVGNGKGFGSKAEVKNTKSLPKGNKRTPPANTMPGFTSKAKSSRGK